MKKLIILFFLFFFSSRLLAQIQDSITVQTHDTAVVKIHENQIPEKRFFNFEIALGVSASSNGFGVSVNTALNKKLAFRLAYEAVDMTFKNAFTYHQDNYSFNVTPNWKAGGVSAIIDYYLLKSLYLSGGVVYTNFNLSANIKSQHSIKIGDIEFQPNEMGELGLTVHPKARLAPYLGFGIGRNISLDYRLCMSFEMGAYFMKSYVVSLTGTQLFQANGEPENQDSLNKLNDTLKNTSWSGLYPVIKLGISYKFYSETKKSDHLKIRQ